MPSKSVNTSQCNTEIDFSEQGVSHNKSAPIHELSNICALDREILEDEQKTIDNFLNNDVIFRNRPFQFGEYP